MKTLEAAQKQYNQAHFLLTCPYCGTELVIAQNELTKQQDVYKDIKCCYCGHVWDEPVKDMYKKHCNPDGKQTKIFELTEEETKRAKAFQDKHTHHQEFKSQGKLSFTTLGHQFTYMITPGLGNIVSIKCNECGETENITNVDNW